MTVALITGGTGFIGAELARQLVDAQVDVRVLALTNNEKEERNAERLRELGASVINGSVTSSSDVERAVEGASAVYHLAAAQHESNVPDSYFREINVDGTKLVLDAAAAAGVERFLYGSTIGVYGDPDVEVISESTPPRPDNIYGKTKLEAEKLVKNHDSAMFRCIVRISETYGPGDYRLIKLFKAIAARRFPIMGDGTNLHQLVYVEDLAKGLVSALNTDRMANELVVLAGPDRVTTNEMTAIVAEAMNARPPGIRVPLAPMYLAARILELVFKPFGVEPPIHRRRLGFFRNSFQFSGEKAKALLGFDPQIDFSTGARRTADWYRAQGLI